MDTFDPEYGEHIHILAEVSDDSTGNFPQITREVILKSLPKTDQAIFNYKGKYIFHILKDESFVYVCLTDDAYPKRRGQAYLAEIKKMFVGKFSQDQRDRAISFSLNDSFKGTVLEKMKFYNENQLDDKMARIRGDAQATLGVMEQNLESIMERGEKIELLVKKTGALKNESSTLKGRSEKLKEKNRNEYLKRNILIGAGIAAIIVIFFLI